MERKHRGCSEKLIVTGENTKKQPDWKTFLANEENNKQLIFSCFQFQYQRELSLLVIPTRSEGG
jgi:hypothetical protein